MGGNAFKQLLPDASFPRMSPSIYNALKSQLLPILQTLYTHVSVSPERPGKVDHGDLDFIVCGPRECLTHEEVKHALRASYSVPLEGNRTSNYAIPADAFEAVVRARVPDPHDTGGETNDLTGKHTEIFFQVDVDVCADHAQLERTVFCHSFGDLGFILGLLAQSAGLSFSIFGLKLADPLPTSPAQTFYLSTSLEDILLLFGLSMNRWKQGFATQEDIFEWIATSPFVLPLVARYRSADYKPPAKERIDTRPLRQNFVHFLRTHDIDIDPARLCRRPPVEGERATPASSEALALFAAPGNYEEKIDAALRFFGKDKEHASLLFVARAQKRAREILNGTNVQEWTGVMGMPIRFVMDEVKERLSDTVARSGDPGEIEGVHGWQRALLDMSDEEVRALVVAVKEEMQKDGRLEFDWRLAKAAKLERKRKKEQEQEQENNGSVHAAEEQGAIADA